MTGFKKAVNVAIESLNIYVRCNVSRAAAALSYFLMLTIFPMLICLYEMLGSLFPNQGAIYETFGGILPENTMDLISDFLSYVMQNHSKMMLTAAIIAMCTMSAAGFRTINVVMGEIRGKRRFSGIFGLAFSFIFSIVFLAAMYFAAIILLTGNWFLTFINRNFDFIEISNSWRWVRFLLLFLLIFVINIGLYRLTAPKKGKVHLVAGAFLSALAVVGVSILFSYFIGFSVKYPLVYGSLASVMILLIWLYLYGSIVIAGNVINVALEHCEARWSREKGHEN